MCGSVVITLILVTLIVLCVCYCYKKKRSKERAEARELRELVESERELNEKKQGELEQQVENMLSQVTMVHTQMKGGHARGVSRCERKLTHKLAYALTKP